MKKFVLLFIVLLGVGCEKSETYDNPYYTKEQFAIIETLCNHEWLNVKEFNYYYGSRFYTINNQPFNIFYTGGQSIETVDGIWMEQVGWNKLWHYFKLDFDSYNNITISFYQIEPSSTTDTQQKLEWIISNLPPTMPNVLSKPIPLKIWEESGISYIQYADFIGYCQ